MTTRPMGSTAPDDAVSEASSWERHRAARWLRWREHSSHVAKRHLVAVWSSHEEDRQDRLRSSRHTTPHRSVGAWIHTFTVGVIGTAIIAMITWTARGHTGRELVAGKVEVASCGLFILATLVRVLGPWLAPQFTMAWIYASGLCWAAALVLYCVRYGAWLVLARVDGKPG
ncbi:NnrS family protein [Paraburkholderia sp. JPY419]|uniref:NnrS family protein n=1 Tax=Paraburkholderia sp. JPY419 TaxID=667660 RepID=UPI003D247CF3